MKRDVLAAGVGAIAVILLLGVASPLVLRTDGIQFPDGSVQTTAAGATKSFYVTESNWDGASAEAACADGFHMAALWEIFHFSLLHYANEVPDARRNLDSGLGPPAGYLGWIQTGLNSNTHEEAGEANCGLWNSNSSDDFGTTVNLESFWENRNVGDTLVPPGYMGPWDADSRGCASSFPVWCVSD